MNLYNLTLGQIKELQSIFSKGKSAEQHPDIGKKVIIRTYSAGVHYGTLVKKDGGECILKDAIRIYYWSGAFTLSEMAMSGVSKIEACKFSKPVDQITLQWIEIIPCTEQSSNIIESVKPYECY